MRPILVTGGAGFIGSHLVQRLITEGHRVLVVDDLSTGSLENLSEVSASSGFDFVNADVTEGTLPAASMIFHLACPASPVHYQADMVKTLMTAALGTQRVLAAAERSGARVLIASTSEIYGEPLVHPQREDYCGNVNPVGPRACYDEGKRCAEAFATAYGTQRGVDARLVRIFNTYGPRMCRDDGRVVSNFVYQALTNSPLTLYGQGAQTRSFCFVSDLVEGLMKVMFARENVGPVNLGNPDERTVGELASLVLRLTGSTARTVKKPMPIDDPTRRKPDISKARRKLGWFPVITLEEGLVETIADARQRLGSAENPQKEQSHESHRAGQRVRRADARGGPR